MKRTVESSDKDSYTQTSVFGVAHRPPFRPGFEILAMAVRRQAGPPATGNDSVVVALLHSQLEGGLEDMGGLLRKRGCREMDANCIPDQMNHAMFALADISPPGAFSQDNSMLAHGLLLIFTLP